MAITQTDVDALETALVSGHLKVDVAGKSVTYRSVAQLKSALAYAKQQVASAAGTSLGTTYAWMDRS